MRSDQKTKKQRSPPSPRWPVYRHVIFDCDSTLTGIEGIDELASHSDTRQRVADLTRSAMDGKVNLETVYGERLEILQPTRGAVRALRSRYRKHVVKDAAALIQALQVLGHEVYIVSAGLFDPVCEFGLQLGVAPEHIRAVEVEYDTVSGNWWQGQGPWITRVMLSGIPILQNASHGHRPISCACFMRQSLTLSRSKRRMA
jgi:hypothetical protein